MTRPYMSTHVLRNATVTARGHMCADATSSDGSMTYRAQTSRLDGGS